MIPLMGGNAKTAFEPMDPLVDSFGNIQLRSIDRPHKYGISMENDEKDLIAGDVNRDNEVNIADVNMIIDILLGSGRPSCIAITDCNADGEINVADVNKIIDYILK